MGRECESGKEGRKPIKSAEKQVTLYGVRSGLPYGAVVNRRR